MKKLSLLLFVFIAITQCAIAQSMLCTYKGGYFIRNGNTWYEYRPEQKSSVWATYSQYNTDNNYFYIKNNSCSVCIPKEKHNQIYLYNKNTGKWEVVYNTVNIYSYCPVRSSQIFTYDNGFFVKDGTTWNFYIPSKKSDNSWATYNQYSVDDGFYYIKNSTDDLAIPRKAQNNFYWKKNGEWKTLYTTLALYDGNSPEAKSGNNYDAQNSSSSSSGYSNGNSYNHNNNSGYTSGQKKSWRQQLGNGGYTDYTLNEDGSLFARTVQPCIWCHGNKFCSICNGQGGVYGRAYGGMWYTCKSCGGTKICQYCHGTGYSTLTSTTRNGVSIGYDQNGNMYSGGGNSGNSGSSGSSDGSSKSSSGSCSLCHGTGVNPSSNSGGSLSSWVAYYNSQGTQCPYCKSYTAHYHDRCPRCNVPR